VITRQTIALTPLLLLAGIIVQSVALLLIIVLWVPCLIWPEILNGPYRWITKVGARIMVRTVVRRSGPRRTDTETAA